MSSEMRYNGCKPTSMMSDALLPRPSSTVVLVRPSVGAPEVFMVKRHARASFGSKFAFPGGVLEDADAEVQDLCEGVSAEQANKLLALESGGLEYYSAAIRELFEESGVLLAKHGLSADRLNTARVSLNAGTLDWQRFAFESELTLQCDRLHYFSFWITPVGAPKRYSARFFLAKVPQAQEASHDGGELTESCWMTAVDILAARKKKAMKLPYVTQKTLKRVAQLADTSALIAWAAACGERGVVCDQPAYRPEEFA
jgi:8-oxo-dGTP pyrophosphatase MutT (NUDIX family)